MRVANDPFKKVKKMIKDLIVKLMEEANEEEEKNTVTIADAQAAQTAVANALGVLNEFYAKAAEATSLVQKSSEPEIFSDEPYKGMGGESGGVIGMIEVIQSDFARLESETSAAEAE